MNWKQISYLLSIPFKADTVNARVSRVSESDRGVRVALLHYIDARAVFDRLDAVVGPGNWMTRLERIQDGFIAELAIKDPQTGEWIRRQDVSDNTDFESTKGGASGAIKRVAVQFGIGRYLYDLPEMWVSASKEKVQGGQWFTAKLKNGQTFSGYYEPPQLPHEARHPSESMESLRHWVRRYDPRYEIPKDGSPAELWAKFIREKLAEGS